MIHKVKLLEDLLEAATGLCQVAGLPAPLDMRLFNVAGRLEECRAELRMIGDSLRKMEVV